jgi:hypothetical protein
MKRPNDPIDYCDGAQTIATSDQSPLDSEWFRGDLSADLYAISERPPRYSAAQRHVRKSPMRSEIQGQ